MKTLFSLFLWLGMLFLFSAAPNSATLTSGASMESFGCKFCCTGTSGVCKGCGMTTKGKLVTCPTEQ